jgi:hypothetical protein
MYLNQNDRYSILQHDKIIQIYCILIAADIVTIVGRNQGVILKVAKGASGGSGKNAK